MYTVKPNVYKPRISEPVRLNFDQDHLYTKTCLG